jgi:hypothetical protein
MILFHEVLSHISEQQFLNVKMPKAMYSTVSAKKIVTTVKNYAKV